MMKGIPHFHTQANAYFITYECSSIDMNTIQMNASYWMKCS